MKTLTAYVEQANKWNAIFKGEQFTLDTAKGRQRIADKLDADLSPENLTCDGELSNAQVRAKYTQLTTALNELKLLDPNVTMWSFDGA